MVKAAVCQPLAASPPNRVELFREFLDCGFGDFLGVRGECLAGVEVFEV